MFLKIKYLLKLFFHRANRNGLAKAVPSGLNSGGTIFTTKAECSNALPLRDGIARAKFFITNYSFNFRLFLLLVFSSISFILPAQVHNVTGTVTDTIGKFPLQGAIAKLISRDDSTKWRGGSVDSLGTFVLPYIPDGSYNLQISYIGYQTITRRVKVNGADRNLGNIAMIKSATNMKEVPIVAVQKHVEQREDTTEYSANAYKVNPDATAEDLVSKMPGISSNNGTVTAHGETVQQVYVDGREFFGEDATLALKNLPAEIIDKVQIFDKMSDQAQFTGFDDGNTVKAMNITTKRGRNNGWFGRLYAGDGDIGDGSGNRYSVGGNINWFDGNRRLSIIGMSNNVNQQNFSTQDLLGVTSGTSNRGGPGGGGGFRGGGGGGAGGGGGGPGGYGGQAANNFLVGQTGGISTTSSAGVNYSDVWAKKIKITASYFFNQTNNVTDLSLNRQYYSKSDTSDTYNETDHTVTANTNHRVSLRFDYSPDSMNRLLFTPKIAIQQNNQTNTQAGVRTAGDVTSETANSYTDAYNFGYNITGDLHFQHKFKKPRRTFSVDVNYVVNNKKGHSSLNSNTIAYYVDTANMTLEDTTPINQQTTTYTYSYSVSASCNYTEPLGKHSMLQINYVPGNQWNITNQSTYNYNAAEQAYNMLDTTLSNKYNNIYMTHRGGLSYRYLSTKKTLMLMFRVNAQYALLSGNEVFPAPGPEQREFFNVLPGAMFTYRFVNKSSLRIYYNTSTTPPSISQLQSVVNNSNPLLLTTGNPDLKQQYTQSLILRYGLAGGKTQHSFFAFGSVNYIQHYIGNATLLATDDTLHSGAIPIPPGVQLTYPVNLNLSNWSFNSFLVYGIPLDVIKCNLNLNGGFMYSFVPSLINNGTNLSNSYNTNGGFVFSSNISEKYDFTISYALNYNVVENSLQNYSNNTYYTHTINAKFNWLFYKGFVFNTSLQNVVYSGVGQGFNEDIYLWYLALGYKFLKDKSLDLRASLNDVLNQNVAVSRTVTETYIEDDRTQVIKRYGLLTLTWTLRYFKKPAYVPRGTMGG